jgi:4-diphosphocytidyl-2-C-methyl-D-erythritol kinase
MTNSQHLLRVVKPMIHEFAPAKINLYLHITGRRADGYHDLDSLVVFAGVGDEIHLETAKEFQFKIEGPQAGALANEPTDNNLAVKAAKSLAALTGKPLNAAITLVKNLPVASGIGGGSSDAAATLRALAKHWGIAPTDPRLTQAAAEHGQDVPVCLKIENNRMTATGTEPAAALPYADIVLVNPNKALATPAVYKAFRESSHDFSPHASFADAPKDLETLIMLLKERHNDLQEPAEQLMPEIPAVIGALDATEDCLFAQMSGSGATCFGFYPNRSAARQAASFILKKHPDWWVVQSYIPCHSDPRQNF